MSVVVISVTLLECILFVGALYCVYKGCKKDIASNLSKNTLPTRMSISSDNGSFPSSVSSEKDAAETEPPSYISVVTTASIP